MEISMVITRKMKSKYTNIAVETKRKEKKRGERTKYKAKTTIKLHHLYNIKYQKRSSRTQADL